MQNQLWNKGVWLTLSCDSKSENSNKSSTSQEGVKLGTCWEGASRETCGAVLLLGGSKWVLSLSSVHLESELMATRIPVARKRWWFAETLPAEWTGSSQSSQNSALSSTQNMKAVLSWKKDRTKWATI